MFMLLKSDRCKWCLVMLSHSFVRKITHKEVSAWVRLFNGCRFFPSSLCNATLLLPQHWNGISFSSPLNMRWACDLALTNRMCWHWRSVTSRDEASRDLAVYIFFLFDHCSESSTQGSQFSHVEENWNAPSGTQSPNMWKRPFWIF